MELNILGATGDGASVNNVATRAVNFIYNKLIDVRCFLDLVVINWKPHLLLALLHIHDHSFRTKAIWT